MLSAPGRTDEQQVETLSVAALTVWSGNDSRRYTPDSLRPGTGDSRAIADAARKQLPVWLDLDLDTDVQTWMDPWDSWEEKPTDWRLGNVAAVLGLDLPDGSWDPTPATSPIARLIHHLQFVNEFGVLRSLKPEVFGKGAPELVIPLAGFVPANTLQRVGESRSEAPEFVLLRVNLAVVGNYLVTIRLTDRLCSGSRQQVRRFRLKAADYYSRPNLTVFKRFLPANREPTPMDLGEALAVYLVATCGSVSEYARRRLREVERGVVALGRDTLSSPSDTGIPEVPVRDNETFEIFEIRGALESVEEELLRILQRLSDAEAGDPALLRIRQRYEEGVTNLSSVEAEARWAADAAANRLATLQLRRQQEAERRQRDAEALARQAQEEAAHRQKKLETVIAGLGTALVIAALVPSLFGESAKLPHPTGSWWDFIGMVLIMIGSALSVFWVLLTLLSIRTTPGDGRSPEPGERRLLAAAMVNASALAVVVAGIAVLYWLGG
jgi:hypothetical protein